ncbi:hypothetical protein [Longispora albida]|uniref:hypothetical protein n=1 Tax=Longispora albida TaxID=203523 RepID=UPI00038034FA
MIRPAQPSELPALTTYPGDDERNASTAAYLEQLFTTGCSRPEWCLVAERDGTLIGNIVLWAVPGRDVPSDFVLFEPSDAGTGAALLAEAGRFAAGLGAGRQAHVLDIPAGAPQYQRDPQLRQSLLAEAGFTMDRDGRRFVWEAGRDAMPAQDDRLTWRSLAELGPEPFVDLLAELLSDTKDSIMGAEVAELGIRGAAELNFREMTEMEHEPHWFEIGYEADGTPVALSLPARNPGSAVIGLVGVAPAGRGKGYSTSIVARGTKILTEAGATEIRGDCDDANIGMFKGFLKASYRNYTDRKMFSRALGQEVT